MYTLAEQYLADWQTDRKKVVTRPAGLTYPLVCWNAASTWTVASCWVMDEIYQTSLEVLKPAYVAVVAVLPAASVLLLLLLLLHHLSCANK
jgi:hypothetical protein